MLRKFIFNFFFFLIFCSLSRLVGVFTTNVKTAMVLEGLRTGNNSIAEYTNNFPQVVSVVFLIIALYFAARASVAIIKYFKEKF